jgi:hypothetical protein
MTSPVLVLDPTVEPVANALTSPLTLMERKEYVISRANSVIVPEASIYAIDIKRFTRLGPDPAKPEWYRSREAFCEWQVPLPGSRYSLLALELE